MILYGWDAIEHAEEHGLLLNKYDDPTEPAQSGLTVEEAKKIANEDPLLIWVRTCHGQCGRC